MTKAKVFDAARQAFRLHYERPPSHVAYAPGRVNLLGEHTDYNGGLVLPMPLALGTAVAIGPSAHKGQIEISSDAFDIVETRQLSETSTGAWSDYVLGSVIEMETSTNTGWQVAVATDLPLGSGLSSSAAIEIATMRAMAEAISQTVDPVELAKRARAVENDYVGLPCGIMDQFCVSVGTPGSALFLDTRTLEFEPVSLARNHKFVVVHSGVTHKLTDDGYATRVKECQAACQMLDVEMLSDLSTKDLNRIATLPSPLNGRARHIVTENARVRRAVEALRASDVSTFGQLMIESHASQRDDYAVSVPEVDQLVSLALDVGAAGARLTGGGFGGSIVALVAEDQIDHWCKEIEKLNPKAKVLAIT